jgi:hypothetical protein
MKEDAIKNLIKEKLVNHHLRCSVDKYGQMSALDFYQIFQKEDGDKIIEYLNGNKGILNLCTYGGRFGTYKGIAEILDPNIKNECKEAFAKNPNYKDAMTR